MVLLSMVLVILFLKMFNLVPHFSDVSHLHGLRLYFFPKGSKIIEGTVAFVGPSSNSVSTVLLVIDFS